MDYFDSLSITFVYGFIPCISFQEPIEMKLKKDNKNVEIIYDYYDEKSEELIFS